jgi:DNA polymerase III subunit epsilon
MRVWRDWFAALQPHFDRQHPMNLAWRQREFLVLDMETTGLDANKDRVLSLGWVLIQQGAIKLGSARHILLDHGPIELQNVGLHMITDQDIEDQGRNPHSAMRYLRTLLQNRILVVHHAPIETQFLKRLWHQYQLKPLNVVVIDTLAMERTFKQKTNDVLRQDAFRLGACRHRYGLPTYGAHDALTDAMGTAELLLAQIEYAGADKITLKELMRLGGKRYVFKSRPRE